MQLVTTDGVRQQRSIHFETRQGTSIVNSQSPAIAEGQRAYFPWFQNKYPKVIHRSDPSGFYNCHGLVFASRRAAIYRVEEVHKILNEDGYSEIKARTTMPGDDIFDSLPPSNYSGVEPGPFAGVAVR